MRLANRLLAVVVALTLTVGGLLVAAEVGWATLGRGPWLIPYDDWYADARTNSWDSGAARSTFLVVAAAGLILVVLQLLKPRPRSLPLHGGQTRAGLSRRSAEQALARAVGHQDGIASAKAAIGRRRIHVSAVTQRTQEDVRARVEEAARTSLGRLGLDPDGDLSIDVQRRSR
jgi:Family of unknown function (DUF6286)